jgi:chromosome segregation ATPase
MARPGIRYEQVAEAADRLMAQGSAPTTTLIRVELGGTGSLSTITQHLRTWQDQRHPTIEAAMAVEVPEGVQRVLKQLWPALQMEGNALIEAVKEDAEQRVQKSRQREQDMASELARMETAAEDMKSQLQAEIAEKEELQRNLVIAREHAEQSEARVQEAEIQIQQAKAELETAQRDAAVSEARRGETAQALADFKAENTELKQALEDIKGHLQAEEKAKQILEQQLAVTQERADRAEARALESDKQERVARDQIESSRLEAAVAEAHREEATLALSEFKQELVELKQTNKALQAEQVKLLKAQGASPKAKG